MNEDNLVSFGINFMVQTTSLAILEAASEGLLTPLRVWRWVTIAGKNRGYAMEDWIKYDGPTIEQYSEPLHGLADEELPGLEDKSDKEIWEALIFRGRFWVWMRPDRYVDSS